MCEYFVLLASVILFYILAKIVLFNYKVGCKYCCLIAAIPLFVMAAVRYDVGSDYFNYLDYVSFYISRWGTEPVFGFLNKIIIWFDLSPIWIHVFFSAIFCFFVATSIGEDSSMPILSLVLLVIAKHYFDFLNISRQMCSCAILLYSIKYIVKKELIKYLICIFLATGLHKLSILFLPMYFISSINFSFLSIGCISIGLGAFKPILDNFFRNLIALTPYSRYIGRSYDSGASHYFYILINISILLLAIIYNRKDNKYKTYLNIEIVALWVSILLNNFPLSRRIIVLWYLPSINLIAMSCGNIKNKISQTIILFVIILCFSLYCFISLVGGAYGVIPYRSLFEFLW